MLILQAFFEVSAFSQVTATPKPCFGGQGQHGGVPGDPHSITHRVALGTACHNLEPGHFQLPSLLPLFRLVESGVSLWC